MSAEGIKISDLLKNKKNSYSFEVTPDISMEDIDNLRVEPTFFSITWHSKTHQCENLDIAPLKLAGALSRKGKNVLLHLACDMLKKDYLNNVLAKLQEMRVCNLFVILGESFESSKSDFQNSKELIKHIRNHTGNYFCVGVAGFPDRVEKILQFKEKIDSGADFIITQAFFETDNYKKFIDKCQSVDINVPIIPGIFLYETYQELIGFTKKCKVKVSDDLLKHVENNEEVDTPGTVISKKMIKDIMNLEYGLKHFHFFTLNKFDKVSKFIEAINCE